MHLSTIYSKIKRLLEQLNIFQYICTLNEYIYSKYYNVNMADCWLCN